MNKEEILAKSRAEDNDEWERHVLQESRRYGLGVLGCVVILMMFYNLALSRIRGGTVDFGTCNYLVFAIWWAYGVGDRLARYRLTRARGMLWQLLVWALADACFLLGYIIASLQGAGVL